MERVRELLRWLPNVIVSAETVPGVWDSWFQELCDFDHVHGVSKDLKILVGRICKDFSDKKWAFIRAQEALRDQPM